MLSFQQRQEAFLFSFIAALALLGLILGLFSCFMLFPESKAKQSRQAALHLAEQASGYNHQNIYSLYQLSEQKALNAIKLQPFKSQNWHSLSDILRLMGKEKQSMKALKIAYMFKDSKKAPYKLSQPHSFRLSMRDINPQ